MVVCGENEMGCGNNVVVCGENELECGVIEVGRVENDVGSEDEATVIDDVLAA